MADLIPPGERRELRSVVRQQFKVLRAEVKQREAELTAEAECRLVERYRDEDKLIEDMNWRIQEIGREAQRQIQDLLKETGDGLDGGGWRAAGYIRRVEVPQIARKSEDRAQLHKALVAGIKEQVLQAQLALDRQEADLLRSLALESLETDQGRAFLARIPTVGELVPAARLREIEPAVAERTGHTVPNLFGDEERIAEVRRWSAGDQPFLPAGIVLVELLAAIDRRDAYIADRLLTIAAEQARAADAMTESSRHDRDAP